MSTSIQRNPSQGKEEKNKYLKSHIIEDKEGDKLMRNIASWLWKPCSSGETVLKSSGYGGRKRILM